jgi:hypothetical protein
VRDSGATNFNGFFSCHSTGTHYTGLASATPMEHQRIYDIKKSLEDITMDELEEMSKNLNKLVHVLVARQIAVEDTILERLEGVFAQ